MTEFWESSLNVSGPQCILIHPVDIHLSALRGNFVAIQCIQSAQWDTISCGFSPGNSSHAGGRINTSEISGAQLYRQNTGALGKTSRSELYRGDAREFQVLLQSFRGDYSCLCDPLWTLASLTTNALLLYLPLPSPQRLGPTQSPSHCVPGVKRPGREADRSPPYVFMAWCLIS
jgi:hypothetical protein